MDRMFPGALVLMTLLASFICVADLVRVGGASMDAVDYASRLIGAGLLRDRPWRAADCRDSISAARPYRAVSDTPRRLRAEPLIHRKNRERRFDRG